MTNQVPDTIWQQLSLQTKMSVGARSPLGDRDTLSFVVGRGQLRMIHVTLDPSDTYTVKLTKFNPKTLVTKVLEEVSDVYCDVLNETVYRMVNK